MAHETPHPFPRHLLSDVNFQLNHLEIKDSNARFVIRRMLADAYAAGFNEGAMFGMDNAWSDIRAEREAAEASGNV